MPVITYKKHVDRPQMTEGEHTLTITKYEEKFAPNGGIPVVEISVENEEGAVLTRQTFYFTEKAAWRINALLGAIGYDLAENSELEVDESLLLNQSFLGVVGYGKPNAKGDKYLEIKRFIENPIKKKPKKSAPKPKQDEDEIPF